MKKAPFLPADILIPNEEMSKWAVIACDQFTSDESYWSKVESFVGESRSALRITLPEIYLEKDNVDSRIAAVNETMKAYLDEGIFRTLENAFVYIERTQPDGRIRRGILGRVDLEEYDYRKGADTLVRATEGTVLSRIPPRVKIRRNAPLELPHVMLLADDKENVLFATLDEKKDTFEKVYDFDLMMGGGHIVGYRLPADQTERILAAQETLMGGKDNPLLFAVGDGNHSLATAKECYTLLKQSIGEEKAKNHPARYALVEAVNIHDAALDFEPIYRVIFDCDTEELKKDLKAHFEAADNNAFFEYVTKEGREQIPMTLAEGQLIVGALQDYLDEWLKAHPAARVDYIHEEGETVALAQKDHAAGFLFTGMGKADLFPAVAASGSLPRKTFSMGVSRDKRYYLEARRITEH
ncbi:MAG: DUF1015 domain-containing protein [Ruminococcaceae bacterium]|nr:DUF1015 domain-containing protein [Oscillospiraceae bacterium]